MAAPQRSARWSAAKQALAHRVRPPVSRRSRFGLDAANFFLAELFGIGSPYIGDLLHDRGWGYGPIGIAAAMPGLGVCLLQTLAGLYLDRARRPRVIFAVAAVLVGVCYAILPSLTHLHFAVYATLFGSGLFQSVFGPLLAGIALGLAGHKHLQRVVGANQAFNHLGDVVASLIALFIIRVDVAYVFYLVGCIAVLAAGSALVIKRSEIDLDRARGGTHKRARFRALFKDRRVIVLLVSVLLFHTAYASGFSFLTLRARTHGGSNATVAEMVLVTQGFMVPVAVVTGPLVEAWGRKPVFAFAFVIMAVFLLICTFVDAATPLIGLQAIGCIGPGILGVALTVVCADLARGTGHYHALNAAARTAMGAGATAGTLGTGFLVAHLGYYWAIGILTIIAFIAAALFVCKMPETRPSDDELAAA
jgi:predicted MFS family arabinose efflux permease